MSSSMAEKFFDGKAFADWKKGKESESKLQAAIVNRLSDVIRASNIVAKTIARTH